MQNLRKNFLGSMASLDNCKQGRSSKPFGVDPTFLPASKQYNGRVQPGQYYAPEEFASERVPYGFFAVSHMQTEPLAGMDDEFLVYLDTRMTTAQVERAIEYLQEVGVLARDTGGFVFAARD